MQLFQHSWSVVDVFQRQQRAEVVFQRQQHVPSLAAGSIVVIGVEPDHPRQ